MFRSALQEKRNSNYKNQTILYIQSKHYYHNTIALNSYKVLSKLFLYTKNM